MPLDHNAELDVLARSLKAGKCTLFLGAGIHAPPPADKEQLYPASLRPALGKQLARMLADRTDFKRDLPDEDSGDLLRVAQYYESYRGAGGRRELWSEIHQAVEQDKKPSPVLKALAALDFNCIITTNYDTLLEQALRACGKKPYVGIYKKHRELADEPPEDPTPAVPFVFKIHGDIDHPESMVISDEDYIDFILRMRDTEDHRPVSMLLLTQLRRVPTLFVGYRLQDYNLRVLFKTLRGQLDQANLPPNVAVDPWPDKLVARYWGHKYITFVEENAWEFVPRLYERVTGRDLELGGS